MTEKYTECWQTTLTEDIVFTSIEQTSLKIIINAMYELEKRVTELESKLQGDGK